MGYLDNKGLEHYSWLVRNKLAKNDQMTRTNSLVQFCPAPETELEPIVDFIFTETPPSEGEKSPDNPSTITGVSSVDVTRTNTNLLLRKSAESKTFATIDFSCDGNGSYTANGTANAGFSTRDTPGSFRWDLRLLPNDEYVFHFKEGVSNIRCGYTIVYSDGTTNYPGVSEGSIITLTDSVVSCMFYFYGSSGVSYNNAVSSPYLVRSRTDAVFEIPQDTTYTISLNDTYYGGSVNFKTGVMTVTEVGVVYTGDEDITKKEDLGDGTPQYNLPVPGYRVSPTNISVCSHFSLGYTANCFYVRANGGTGLRVYPTGYTTLESFVQWVKTQYTAGTPLTVVYTIATPLTVQLTPVQILSLAQSDKYVPQLNTIYSDQQSVKVGWIREDFIHKSGDENVEGIKVFSNSHATDPVTDSNSRSSSILIKSPDIVRGIVPEYRRFVNLQFVDSSGTDVSQTGRLGSVEYQAPTQTDDGHYSIYLRCWKFLPENAPNPSTGTALTVGYDKNEIPFSTAPATSDDRIDSEDIITRGWIEPKTWNWQKSKKSSCVKVSPLSESVLEPVVDFLFTETLPTNGEKSTTNPSTINAISQVHVGYAGKNLLFPEDFECVPDRGITATVNSDGSISVSGTTSSNGILRFRPGGTSTSNTIKNSPFIVGNTYTVSMECSDSNVVGYVHYSIDGGRNWNERCSFIGGQSRTFTIPSGTTGLQIWTQTIEGITLNTTVKMQCELGTIATPFESGTLNSYNIALGNSYYGGSIDINTGIMTVTYRGIIFNGTENISLINYGDYYQYRLIVNYEDRAPSGDALIPVVNTEKCTHFEIRNTTKLTYEHIIAYGVRIDFFAAQQTLSAFKEWLAAQYSNGTPVTIAYPLEVPYTVQLTSQQIKSLASTDKYMPRTNTIYTDAASVQIGYQRYVDETTIVYQDQRIPEEEIDEAFAE